MIDQNQTELAKIEAAATSFLDYGVGHIAYVRPNKEDSDASYDIYAANGSQIASASDRSSVFGFLMQHDLVPVNLH